MVGLSGGVDSAVTAAVLKDAGAEVIGVFAKGWYPPGLPCTWAEDRRDAMRVAARLGIPFVTFDASKEYKQGVIDYLLSEYKAGRTPNPDVMCNREVKFGALLAFARSHGAKLATGHYARVEDGALYRGADEAKDQSYFLWAVPKDAFKDVLFPLGGLQKTETRSLAKKYGLPVAEKRDSQGICFLGSVSVDDFLRSEFGTQPGEAVDEKGQRVGMHDGATLVTLGERVSLTDALPGPWYVLRKDMERNVLVVGKERTTTSVAQLHLEQVNMLAEGGNVIAQYRYHGPKVKGVFANNVFTPSEVLPEPPAPGQSLVLYRGEQCIGGGIMR